MTTWARHLYEHNDLAISKGEYPQKFEAKTDIECRAFSNTSNNAIAASFQGVLIKNTIQGEP